MNPLSLIVRSANRAKAKWTNRWEGGSHLMRYISSEVRLADTQWKVEPDDEVNGLRIAKADAVAAIKIAGALHRFFEQVGADNVLRVSGLSLPDENLLTQEEINKIFPSSMKQDAERDAFYEGRGIG